MWSGGRDGGEDAATGDTLSSDEGEEMTRDEVMLMTDEELRIKADELLLPGNKIAWFCDRLARFYGDLDYDWLPDYPNDIAAAWELINKLHKQYEVAVFSNYTLLVPITDEFWRCSVSIDQMLIAEAKDADSAPRAITRAFILTMEANDD